jgi:putative hemolysin
MNAVDVQEVLYHLAAMFAILACSAFFSGTEVALFSLRRVDREQMLRSNDRRDNLILRLLSKPARLIATIEIGNETVNVTFSALSAGLCQMLFGGRISNVAMILLSVAASLPLLLFFGEITPKTVAIRVAVPWARRAARLATWFLWLVTPIRVIVHGFARGAVRIFGPAPQAAAAAPLSEAEFKTLVDAGQAEGEVDPTERRIIHKVFEFGDKKTADVMVPRNEVFAMSYDLPIAQLIDQVAAKGFSRIPIFHRSIDNVRGILHAKELLIQAHESVPKKLTDLLQEPLFVAQTMPLKRLFGIFKKRHTHMALVVNEYGKVSGLVTMEDLLEELFGEIRDERELQKSAAILRLPTPGRGEPA